MLPMLMPVAAAPLASLLPSPLHPAIVHLPMALVVLLPPAALVSLWIIRRGARPRAAWGVTLALLGVLAGSSWVATETGEDEGERVERVVPEAALESHEEAAETFLVLAVAVFGVSLLGLRADRFGQIARVTGAAGTIALLGVGWQVGHAGGQLVYVHNAGAAHATSAVTAPGAPTDEVEDRR
ncbi:MAG: hypothetical protein LCH84_02010 [Gemmatimonadetes bacterium]|nr:hypothetical protein [Gemmatimonadota bacterium]